jgi:SAM-dependent MidA family methyltransferase
VVTREGGRLREVYVMVEGGELREKLGPISDPTIAVLLGRYAHEIEAGQRVEVSPRAVPWVRAVAEKLARGFVLTIDYGDLADRLYTTDRSRGTLLAYHGHQTSANFFAAPGEQDLTAHVNFSTLIDAGKEAGLELTGFTTQERFLMALGEENQFADLYDDGQTETEKLQARLQLKRLIYPGGMGGTFKVLVQHRGISTPQLTGLKFARTNSRV